MATAPTIGKKRKDKAPAARNKRPIKRGKKTNVVKPAIAHTALLKEYILKNSDTKFLADLKNSIFHQLAEAIIADCIKTIKRRKLDLLVLAFRTMHGQIDMWAEVKDNDENTLRKLLVVRGDINNRHYYTTQIFMDLMIVEERDNLAIQPHYKPVINSHQ